MSAVIVTIVTQRSSWPPEMIKWVGQAESCVGEIQLTVARLL